MTYKRESLLRGAGRATAEVIDGWFRANAAAGAAYVGLPVAEPPPLGEAIIYWSREWGLNWDLVTGLIAHETAWLQSQIFRDKKNPGGFGAENEDPYNRAVTFHSYSDGVRAVVAHLAGYVFGDGVWNRYSSRYPLVRARDWHGTVGRLYDLEQKWAWSPVEQYLATPEEARYGAALARQANDLLRFAPALEPVVAGSAQKVHKPAMIARPSPNRDGYSTPRLIEAVVIHIATATLESNLDWLTRRGSGASSNAYVAKNGDIYELVPISSSAWTNGIICEPDRSNRLIRGWADAGINPNTRTYTIEMEGEPGDELTGAQLRSVARVIAWVASECGWMVSRERVIGHYQIDFCERAYCPSLTSEEWDTLVEVAAGLRNGGAPPEEPEALYIQEWSVPIILGFRALFLEQGAAKYPEDPVAGGLSLFGLPLEPEQPREWGSEQRFERCVMRWERGMERPWDVVLAHRPEA